MGHEGAPANMQAFEERLLEVSTKLPKRLRQCAHYVAANRDRIAVSTVAEMAEGAGVQRSAFMRFCQIMGFSGFSEMQRLFRGAFVGGWPDYSTRINHLRENSEGSATGLLAEFVDAGRASLEGVLNTVDPEQLELAVQTLATADVIHIIGLRRSFPVASYMAYAFEQMNVSAMLHSTVGGLESRSAIRKTDAVLAVTFSPYSAQTMSVLEDASARNIPIVALTDTSVSPLRKLGATILTVSEMDFGAFRSLSATLCVAITLSVAVGTRRAK